MMATDRRPSFESDPQVLYLHQILDEIRHGLLQIPRFQRPFVWKDEQRLELLSSVLEGTPIGSIMVWRSLVKIECFDRLGPHRLPEAPDRTPRSYLLDGHQRMATLFAALIPPELNLERDEEQEAMAGWQIYYDLLKESCELG